MYPMHGASAYYSPYGYTNYSAPNSPATNTADQPFEFPAVNFPPRLKNLGRQISQMSTELLSTNVSDDEDHVAGNSQKSVQKRIVAEPEPVPGMGDEPVLCPFCNKPLPPAIFASHAQDYPHKTHHALHKKGADSLSGPVKEGDEANHRAAENLITEEEMKGWFAQAGLKMAAEEQEEKKEEEEMKETVKAFPLLPPPPPPAAVPQSRYGLFGRGSSRGNGDDDDEDSDDGGPANGYAQLGAGSMSDGEDDETVERRIAQAKEEREITEKEQAEKERAVNEVKVKDFQEEKRQKPDVVPEKDTAGDDQVKQILVQVLTRVNEMSKSHNALLSSHSSLLTSLKIARSNLAMAEANTEMLEEQLKRGPVSPAPTTGASSTGTGATRAVSGPAPPTTLSALPRRTDSRPASPRPGSTRVSQESQRPPLLSPSNNSNGTGTSADSKPWSFFSNSKKKLPGALGSLPSPAQMMAALPSPSAYESRGTGADYFRGTGAPYSAALSESRPVPTRSVTGGGRGGAGGTGVSKSLVEASSLTRSISATPSSRTPLPNAMTSPTNAELTQLRTAYSSAVSKLSVLSTEITQLKSANTNMENELESLSQALFEEANKMVADERKRRAEVEESLKEVREEREVLKETVKVLGGKVASPELPAEKDEDLDEEKGAESQDTSGSADVVPRDLDKHYAALVKTIHHVSSPPLSPSHPDIPPANHNMHDIVPMPIFAPMPLPEHRIVLPMDIPLPSSGRSTPLDGPSRPVSVSLPVGLAGDNPWANDDMSRNAEFRLSVITPSPRPSPGPAESKIIDEKEEWEAKVNSGETGEGEEE